MRLITKITCNTSLNAKAAALAPFLRIYDGCLLQTEKQWTDFVAQVEKLLEELNADYPRTKPFEIYGYRAVDSRGLCITPEGKSEIFVASVWTEPVRSWLTEDGITPVENLAIECVDKNDFR